MGCRGAAGRRPGGELVSVNQILSVKWRNPLREVLSSRHRESNPLREIFSRRAGCRRVAKSSGPRHSQASGRGAGGAAGAGGHTDGGILSVKSSPVVTVNQILSVKSSPGGRGAAGWRNRLVPGIPRRRGGVPGAPQARAATLIASEPAILIASEPPAS